MAHVGKFYPVHFRRDLNLNISNNNAGYPRAYDCFANDKQGSLGLYLNRVPFHCHAVSERTFQFAKWDQDYQYVRGFYVKFTLTLSGGRQDVYDGPGLVIRERSLGILATYLKRVAGTAGYKQLVLQLDIGSITHPTVYDDQVTQRAGAQAIEWTEYHNIYG
jgi:hypothetical protein